MQNTVAEVVTTGKIGRYARDVHAVAKRDELMYRDRSTGGIFTIRTSANPHVHGDMVYVFELDHLDFNEVLDVEECNCVVYDYEVEQSLRYFQKVNYELAVATRSDDFIKDHNGDILTFLGMADFDFSDYARLEINEIQPALHAKGFADVLFLMGEKDSFGPLSRVIRCKDSSGNAYEFVYG